MSGNPLPEFATLLQTKLRAPSLRPGLVQRSGLEERLSDQLVIGGRFGRRLTVIAAPAGYGKTTLASQWLKGLELPIAWLSLEEADNDPVRFLRYLITALQGVSPDLGQAALGMLSAPQRPPDEAVLTTLINDLTNDPVPKTLVLDDYHAIQALPIHRCMGFILNHIPENLHMVIATREDPPLPVTIWQSKGQALVIRQVELAFTEAEAFAFFRQCIDLDLAGDEAGALVRRTEGWVTGLQLAALSLKDAPDRGAFIRSFAGSNRFVLDYLFEEVFNRQPQDVQAFLLHSAVLERFCGALCDAVLERQDSQGIIEDLERANFFIVPLDQSREWYRYHRLFDDLLLHRLRNIEADLESDLRRKASEWFATHGYSDEAVHYTLAAGDWERAADLIVQNQNAFLRRGELNTVLGWCRRIPQTIVLENFDLALTYAWSLILIGEIPQANEVIETIRGRAGLSDPQKGEIASAQAFIARTLGDLPGTIERSQEALALLPEDDRMGRANLSVNLGIISWHLGQLDETEANLQSALADALATRNYYAAHTAQVFLARSLASRGRLREARTGYQEALAAADRVPTAILAYHDLAAIAYELNELETAFEYLDRAVQIARQVHNREFEAACQIQLALTHLGAGDLASGKQALRDSDLVVKDEELPLLTRARRTACRFQCALAGGDLEDARHWLEAVPIAHDAHPFNRFLDINTARLALAEGRFEQARAHLDTVYEKARQAGWEYAALVVRTHQALAAEDQPRGLEILIEALRLAEAEGFTRVFLDAGPALRPYLMEAARQGVRAQFTGSLLTAFGEPQPKANGGLVEPLTGRECEVLQLVVAGMSNREIANTLVISAGTAKTHVHNLCGKLGVRNRTQAAMRAKELGLV